MSDSKILNPAHLLAGLLLAAAAIAAPQTASATLMGTSVSGCLVAANDCSVADAIDPNVNLFTGINVPNAVVDGGVEFSRAAEFPILANLSADLGTDGGGVDYIEISATNVSFLGPLAWVFRNLTWANDPTGTVSGITLVSGNHGHSAEVTGSNSVRILTDPALQDFTLRFTLTTLAGNPEPDDDPVPAPGVAWLLLPGLLLAWRRSRSG